MRFGVAGLALMAAAGAGAQILEFSGDASLQARWYPESPAFPGQRSSTGGLVVEPTLYGGVGSRASLVLTPLYRYDSADSRRTHADVREAYFLIHGDWGENSWELRLGLDRVFWGVAELHNLVDVVNQLDLVEHPRDRPKLGQPMAHLTVSGDWGIAESFVLPYHRKRTFPGRSGRLRSGFRIDQNALYESGAEERHVDVAFRYSNSVGLLDFGLSAFLGTSREPSFRLGSQAEPSPAIAAGLVFLDVGKGRHSNKVLDAAGPPSTRPEVSSLVPYYEQIRQFGFDAQLTTEPWLYKMEAVQRSGAANLLGQEEDYSAFIFGMERTVYALFGSTADLTVLAEWLYDDRGDRATSVRANDLFIAGFLAFNDVRGTELVAGLLGDLRHDYRALSMELKRRLSDRWSLRVEVIANLRVDPRDLTYDGRRDSFLGAGLTFSF